MIILAADIGGTQARLLLAEVQGSQWQPVRQAVLPSRAFASLQELLAQFLEPGEQPHSSCLALAGPIHQQQVQLTNLPWLVDAGELGRQLHIPRLQLLNDFAAQAHGLPLLADTALCTLQPSTLQPDSSPGTRALLGAGTGLGMALLAGSAEQPQVLASQGGHADFAPTDEQQIELLQFLRRHYPRVSLELLLCGRGLSRLYAFFTAQAADDPELPDARQISQLAEQGDGAAQQSLQLFARLLGSAAGNLALTSLAEGGVYLSGGIAPKILPYLQQPAVLQAFVDKPPMHELLASIGLHVVLDELLGLRGAAQVALQLARRY